MPLTYLFIQGLNRATLGLAENLAGHNMARASRETLRQQGKIIAPMRNHGAASVPVLTNPCAPLPHGDAASSPKPMPRDSSVSDKAAETNAPPITAAHENPDEWAALWPPYRSRRGLFPVITEAKLVCIAFFSAVPVNRRSERAPALNHAH